MVVMGWCSLLNSRLEIENLMWHALDLPIRRIDAFWQSRQLVVVFSVPIYFSGIVQHFAPMLAIGMNPIRFLSNGIIHR